MAFANLEEYFAGKKKLRDPLKTAYNQLVSLNSDLAELEGTSADDLEALGLTADAAANERTGIDSMTALKASFIDFNDKVN